MKLLDFYNDGLKDCSWVPNTYKDFENYCKTKNVTMTDEAIVITNGDKDFLYLDTIYVLKKYRNKGIASNILNSLRGRVALICNKNLLDFYSKFGFTENLPYAIVVKDNR